MERQTPHPRGRSPAWHAAPRRSRSQSPSRASTVPHGPPPRQGSPPSPERPPPERPSPERPPPEKPSLLQRLWARNKPAALVALSQLLAASMNLSARLLELQGDGMHPVQVLLVRHLLTSVGCLVYMWWASVSDAPFGTRDIRWLLLARGFTGFFGILGIWYSMMYLPLADSTVITFLAPGVAGFLCSFILHEPFTRVEQLATVVALLGVVLIARPAALFAEPPPGSAEPLAGPPPGRGLPGLDHETTPRERLLAVGMSLLGVAGGAGAYTTMRAIGRRAHPLISVNVFGLVCIAISLLALTLGPALGIGQPALRWVTPAAPGQWGLLLALALLGFAMQWLLTAGLAGDRSNSANAMVYTHMLFAAAFDRWVFGHRMGLVSFLGCALILGSAIGVLFIKKPPSQPSPPPKSDDVERQANAVGDTEESPLLARPSNGGGHHEPTGTLARRPDRT